MKLYDVPRNTRVRLSESEEKTEVLFDHVDGMYSYCKDKDGNTIHLAAWTEVEIVNDKEII